MRETGPTSTATIFLFLASNSSWDAPLHPGQKISSSTQHKFDAKLSIHDKFFFFHRGSALIPDGTVWEWAPTAVFGKMATFIFYTLTQALRAMKSGDLLFFFMRLSYVGLISDFCFYLLRTHSISDVDWPNLIKSYRRSSSYNRLYGINEWSRDRM